MQNPARCVAGKTAQATDQSPNRTVRSRSGPAFRRRSRELFNDIGLQTDCFEHEAPVNGCDRVAQHEFRVLCLQCHTRLPGRLWSRYGGTVPAHVGIDMVRRSVSR